MSSSVDPIANIPIAIRIGIVKASSLKNITSATIKGMLTAKPPSAGVSILCIAFSGLSKSLSFLLLLGL